MKYRGLSLAFSALAFSASMPISAQTVDFNELHSDSTYLLNSSLTSGGYRFDINPAHRFLIWAPDYPLFDADPSGAALGLQDGGAVVSVSKTGGGAFRLESMELDDIYNGGYSMYGNYGGDVQFTFHLAGGGSASQTIRIDGAPGWETFNFDGIALSSFTMTSLTTAFGLFQLDNMVIRQIGKESARGAVPEPASWMMMLMGCGALGAVIRRRRTSIGFA